jgi:cell division septal protein FtsQ
MVTFQRLIFAIFLMFLSAFSITSEAAYSPVYKFNISGQTWYDTQDEACTVFAAGYGANNLGTYALT